MAAAAIFNGESPEASPEREGEEGLSGDIDLDESAPDTADKGDPDDSSRCVLADAAVVDIMRRESRYRCDAIVEDNC